MYLKYHEVYLTNPSLAETSDYYSRGYLLGRIEPGYLYQSRSLRVDLNKFELSSENRRIQRKFLGLDLLPLPLPHPDYTWEIHRMGKDFYSNKFGESIMSANKIKSICTDPNASSFNLIMEYHLAEETRASGYAICYHDEKVLHYAYPFYELELNGAGFGMAMMLTTLNWAKAHGYNHVYLGTADGEAAKYKLQFSGLQWWNIENKSWDENIQELKQLLATS